MISEKGLCKILKSAYKQGGYSIIPQSLREDGPAGSWRRNTIILNGATWAVRCLTVDLPGKAAVQIVEDAGYLPVEAVNIQKGAPNQLVLEEVAGSRCELLEEQSVGKLRMRKIPVIFRERWQLYQTEQGDVFAFDIELLKLIDFKEVEPVAYMTANGHLGMWFYGDNAVYLAPGRFSRDNEDKILYIAGFDWENQIDMEDPVVNVSLFDEDGDEPLMDQEE